MLAVSCHAPQLQKVFGGGGCGFCDQPVVFNASPGPLPWLALFLSLPDADEVPELPAAGMETGMAATCSGVDSPSKINSAPPGLEDCLTMMFDAVVDAVVAGWIATATGMSADSTWQSIEFGEIEQMFAEEAVVVTQGTGSGRCLCRGS